MYRGLATAAAVLGLIGAGVIYWKTENLWALVIVPVGFAVAYLLERKHQEVSSEDNARQQGQTIDRFVKEKAVRLPPREPARFNDPEKDRGLGMQIWVGEGGMLWFRIFSTGTLDISPWLTGDLVVQLGRNTAVRVALSYKESGLTGSIRYPGDGTLTVNKFETKVAKPVRLAQAA